MGTKMKISEIIDALDMQSDLTHAYVDRTAGSVVHLAGEEIEAAEMGYDRDGYPGWQQEQENVETARAVLEDGEGRFVELPDRFDIDEWRMMRDFSVQVEDDELSESLQRAIHGRGAFRYFRDRVHEAGVADRWYAYRNGRYREIAEQWCRDNNIEFDADA